MKIYTKKGDKGRTSLIGGKIVLKTHARIEAYGTVDELLAHIGLLRDMMTDEMVRQELLEIEDSLMVCAAILASDCEECEIKIPELQESNIVKLEKSIDSMESILPPLKSFVLPGGHVIASQCHVSRTVCRRAEREILRLLPELFVPDVVIKFINRLSDYLFVLSRKVLHDFKQKDIVWIPKL
jgi:cob(I)alamin adenosyltransferase